MFDFGIEMGFLMVPAADIWVREVGAFKFLAGEDIYMEWSNKDEVRGAVSVYSVGII
jgi:hypothetical protein